jgi:DNA-binding response OmpR family regulator
MNRILVVEDEPRIAAFIEKGLKNAGYEVVQTNSGLTAVSFGLHGDFDLIILDIGLPDIEGFEVLERLRGQGVNTPVIMLTARSSAADTVAALTSGADDYMPKPFSFEELLARIQLRIKGASPKESTLLTHKGISVNLQTRQVLAAGIEVELTSREFELLMIFMKNPGQILSREQLLSQVWGLDFDPSSNVVDVYLRYLRKKLGADHFETIRGMGYKLV